ncbi:hypothetical protein J2Y38_002137 [Flavobacterium sp. 2755]|uniref:hypothetical protein n=1 Tax=Flavobacterium sp. 2755 TaxID=2817765 RepID=UPI002864C26A|nr:hypothetical protein [Flavobacterium sp. 2755]MDR6761926.1 hypothetical protein [Flavobacterium sp. 2755]
MISSLYNIQPKDPPFRKLKGYTFDPSLSTKIETVFINSTVYKVIWEKNLQPGPVGEYLEIIDYDPTLKKFYLPVDLNDTYILAQDGLDPSESNPMFHQQMVYAVAMTTIRNFENAMGRKVFWSQREKASGGSKDNKEEFIQRLRIYPHAIRESNAYYSPDKKALLFGYYSSNPEDETLQMPGTLVFTCLSHDIIAHETTHAILDGIFRRYSENTNLDVLAFHEAFSDIVALFQHFTFPEVLKDQIAKTKGDLSKQNILGQLAQQVGSEKGNYAALRDAIGHINPDTGKWEAFEPDGNEYKTQLDPHPRGSILVAAVFEAFLAIYKRRIADLLRIATNGSGILPGGDISQDLVNRLSSEASKAASHVLRMCIRALDYCPPADITFGDYLRAVITADYLVAPEDEQHYRLAFIEAFRRRGIYPAGVRNLSVESLCYPVVVPNTTRQLFGTLTEFLRDFTKALGYEKDRQNIFNITRKYIVGGKKEEWECKEILGLHKRIFSKFSDSTEFEALTGLIIKDDWEALGIATSRQYGPRMATIQVHSLRVAVLPKIDGGQSNQVILTLMQKIRISEDAEKGFTVINGKEKILPEGKKVHFLRGGCTMIFDLDDLQLKYVISKPLLDREKIKKENKREIDAARARALLAYKNKKHDTDQYNAYFAGRQNDNEPFCFLHNH